MTVDNVTVHRETEWTDVIMYEISFDVNVCSTVIMFITHLQSGDRILFVMLTNCHVYVLCICKILIANKTN